jgi:hypothetical protein
VLAGTGVGLAVVPERGAEAHNINMNGVCSPGSTYGIDTRAEIDHPSDANPDHRYFWVYANKADNTSTVTVIPCESNDHSGVYSRLRGETLKSDSENGFYGVCTGTVGDGLGAAGFYHSTSWSLGLNSGWQTSPSCGTGWYRSKTTAGRMAGSWHEGVAVSGAHSFK